MVPQFKFFMLTSSILRKTERKELVRENILFSEINLAEIYDRRNTNG